MKTFVALSLLCAFLSCGLAASLSCSNEYFWDGKNDCLKCPDNCQFCKSRDYFLSCDNGYWGTMCEKPCILCEAETSCRRTRGFCLNACKDGYTGVLCDSRCLSCNRTNAQVCLNCAQGWYQPVSCNKPCPESCYNRSCNATCFCEYGCENGFWGETCERSCSGHCLEAACYQANGSCLSGCKEGYLGTQCEEETSTTIFLLVGTGLALIFLTVVVVRRERQKHTGNKSSSLIYNMAATPGENDFRAVLDKVWENLLDYMDLVPVLEELKKSEVFRPSTLRDLQEKHHITSERISALLQLVKDGGYTRYVQFKQCLGSSGQERLVDKLEAAERGEYKPVVIQRPKTEDEVLKEDLIAYYRERESTISVAPLVEQHDAELTKFYVRPPMMAYNKPNAFGQKKQPKENSKEKMLKEKTNIRSYRELLLKDSNPYRGIYVTADAGMGKTSFAKMLAIKWCEAHTRNAADNYLVEEKSDNECDNEKRSNTVTRASLSLIPVSETEDDAFSDTDADRYTSTDADTPGDSFTDDFYTLEIFEYLFFIKLRDCSDKCMLDDMILEMMKSKLKHKTYYTEEFLQKVLCDKRCLIIVDGLDEWIHPQSCRREEVIPHRKAWPMCTVLTTTRPWKLSTAQLSNADVDWQVEITQLDETSARKLESRAIEILNENQRQTCQVVAKKVTDFKNSVPKTILGHIRFIPFVLLQMICLWFGDSDIGKSLCEVYTNIIELTLTRWLVKTDSGHTDCKCKPSKEHENIKLKCMKNNRHCQRYMPLLLKIGELAFSTLFNDIRDESLLFNKEQVLKYLSKKELEQCLDIGLLSQFKDTTSLTEVRLQLYFPHKTLHEFFCALFIATNWNSTKSGTTSIKQTISSKCTSVSDILEMSEVFVFVCGLNPEVYSDISRPFATIVSTDQSVIDYRNGVEDLGYLLLLWDYQRMQISCFLESTRNQHPECKIVIEDIILHGQMEEYEQQVLVKILSNCACSLKYLAMESFDKTKDSSSAGEIVRILEQTKFSCLERLVVFACEPTLFQSVLTSAAHTLKYLELRYVSLKDDVCSAISTMNNLRGLDLSIVQVSRNSLIVPTLPLLTEFTLEYSDLRDITVTLSLEMTSLKTIRLKTTVNIPCCRELFLSISKLPQPITVKLEYIQMTAGECRELLFDILGKLPKSIHVEMRWCKGPSEEEWRNIFDDMKASIAFRDTCADLGCSEADIIFDTVVV